jgi:hypothetical protein
MQRRFHRAPRYTTVILAALLAFGPAPAAFGDDGGVVTRQTDLTRMLDARERALVYRSETSPVLDLDPAIRTAILARASVAGTTTRAVPPAAAAADGFAWGAAALGFGAALAGVCVLLGCVTLVRHDGRLRSA